MLVNEIAQLENLAASAETRWLRRCAAELDTHDHPPEALQRLRVRVREAQRLLEALRARFLLD